MARMTYDPNELARAAAASSCMTELLDRLGAPSTSGRRSYLRALLAKHEVDVGHWTEPRRSPYSSDDLREAVRGSSSYAGVLRQLGIPLAGGSHACLARRIRAEGFDTSHFLGQAHRRGSVGRRKSADQVLVLLPAGAQRTKTHLLRRALEESGVPHRCALCSCPPVWQDRPLTLVIDHVNGDWLDNRLANLRYLCPNCHAQTATWCRRKSGP